jgi:hypothetical protein
MLLSWIYCFKPRTRSRAGHLHTDRHDHRFHHDHGHALHTDAHGHNDANIDPDRDDHFNAHGLLDSLSAEYKHADLNEYFDEYAHEHPHEYFHAHVYTDAHLYKNVNALTNGHLYTIHHANTIRHRLWRVDKASFVLPDRFIIREPAGRFFIYP